MNKNHSLNFPGMALLLALIGLWQVVAYRAGSPNMPGVDKIATVLWNEAPNLLQELGWTLSRAAAGLLIAISTMILAGLVIGRTSVISSYVMPVIDLLKPLPPIAIAPVAMLFAGTGSAAKIAVVAYGCAFPVLVNTIDAVRGVHPMFGLVAQTFGMSSWEKMLQVDLPAALPRILMGVRTSVSLSLLIAVASEMILSSDGLGNVIVIAQQRFQIAEGLAAICVIVVVGIFISVLWSAFDRRVIAWHYGYLDKKS